MGFVLSARRAPRICTFTKMTGAADLLLMRP